MARFTFSPLTPTAFLQRAATVYAERTAIIDGQRTFTYAEFGDRARRLTGALSGLGIDVGDRVAALCSNSHVMLELHQGVPLRGAILVPINVRLPAPEVAAILRHSGAKLLVATEELASTAQEAAAAAGIGVVLATGPGSEYETRLEEGRVEVAPPSSEEDVLAINYTSGTTGSPRGVMYHHRGAYLQSLAMALHLRLGVDSTYLWTLPMFHCNGWSFTWALSAVGSTNVCLRTFDPGEAWRLMGEHGVTHLSAAPTVLTMLHRHPDAPRGSDGEPPPQRINVTTGGAPPSPALLERLAEVGMDVTHLYGLTETFGPIVINVRARLDADRSPRDAARLTARQGSGNVVAEAIRVVDVEGRDVRSDGTEVGEIVVRGNNVMLGYYHDDEATAEADLDGWFRTGDLAVMHPEGDVEIKDRSKDLIISGGENIASVEVERVIAEHPAVGEVAVVGWPDEFWGQIPVAFVDLSPDAAVSEADLIAWTKERLARYKAPRKVVFTSLPKTSTGKIQKNLLRERSGPDPL